MFSIFYTEDGVIFKYGPFDTMDLALKWAKENNYQGQNGESLFDIDDQRVYLLHPNHHLEELSISDLK